MPRKENPIRDRVMIKMYGVMALDQISGDLSYSIMRVHSRIGKTASASRMRKNGGSNPQAPASEVQSRRSRDLLGQ